MLLQIAAVFLCSKQVKQKFSDTGIERDLFTTSWKGYQIKWNNFTCHLEQIVNSSMERFYEAIDFFESHFLILLTISRDMRILFDHRKPFIAEEGHQINLLTPFRWT